MKNKKINQMSPHQIRNAIRKAALSGDMRSAHVRRLKEARRSAKKRENKGGVK